MEKRSYCMNFSIQTQFCISDLIGLFGLKRRAGLDPAKVWVTWYKDISWKSNTLRYGSISVCRWVAFLWLSTFMIRNIPFLEYQVPLSTSLYSCFSTYPSLDSSIRPLFTRCGIGWIYDNSMQRKMLFPQGLKYFEDRRFIFKERQ